MNEEQKQEVEARCVRNQRLSGIREAFQAVRQNAISHDETFRYAMLIPIEDFNRLSKAALEFYNSIIRDKVKLPVPDFGPVADLALRTRTSVILEERLAFLGTWGSAERVEIYAGPEGDYFDFTIFGPPIDGKPNRILVGGVKYYPNDRDWQIHT